MNKERIIENIVEVCKKYCKNLEDYEIEELVASKYEERENENLEEFIQEIIFDVINKDYLNDKQLLSNEGLINVAYDGKMTTPQIFVPTTEAGTIYVEGSKVIGESDKADKFPPIMGSIAIKEPEKPVLMGDIAFPIDDVLDNGDYDFGEEETEDENDLPISNTPPLAGKIVNTGADSGFPPLAGDIVMPPINVPPTILPPHKPKLPKLPKGGFTPEPLAGDVIINPNELGSMFGDAPLAGDVINLPKTRDIKKRDPKDIFPVDTKIMGKTTISDTKNMGMGILVSPERINELQAKIEEIYKSIEESKKTPTTADRLAQLKESIKDKFILKEKINKLSPEEQLAKIESSIGKTRTVITQTRNKALSYLMAKEAMFKISEDQLEEEKQGSK